MLPAGDGFTLGQWCPVSHKESPGGGVDFLQWSTVFWILFFEFHKNCWIRSSTWESFIGFHLWGSPISSVFNFRYVGDRISWKMWCWNEKEGGWDVISCLLLSCVLYCMEGEFEQIITKERQQQVTPEWVSLTFIWYFLQILRSYFYPIQTL